MGNVNAREVIIDHSTNGPSIEYEAAKALVSLNSSPENETPEHRAAVAYLRNLLTSPIPTLRFASVRALNEHSATHNNDVRFWSTHRVGNVCKLHLLNKRYKIGDHITGILDFSSSNLICAKYIVILQCEETQQFEFKQEFTIGIRRTNFTITFPLVTSKSSSILHCVLSFLFYIADKNYPKTLFEDRAGTIELGPSELETKLFSCDFPIAIHN